LLVAARRRRRKPTAGGGAAAALQRRRAGGEARRREDEIRGGHRPDGKKIFRIKTGFVICGKVPKPDVLYGLLSTTINLRVGEPEAGLPAQGPALGGTGPF
jgi:hypothetical protein